MIKAHKIRLNPTPEQEQYFYRASGIARLAWNWALEEYHRMKAKGLKADWNEIKKEFRRQIDSSFPFVRDVTKCAPEQAISDLRQSISTYHKVKKANPESKVRFPKRRKRSKKVGGFGLANDKFSIDGHTVKLPKMNEVQPQEDGSELIVKIDPSVNMTEQVRFNGKIMSGRVVEKAGRWYLVVTVEVKGEPTISPALRLAVGIDFGLSKFATLSNGEVSETQAYLRRSEDKLARLQRGLFRKKKGSKNRTKWKGRVARLHERIANLRADHLNKFTTDLVKNFKVVCVETLNLKGLVRTKLAKSFNDAGIGMAIGMLEAKAVEYGCVIQKVGQFFASSKLCSKCGRRNGDLLLSDREWTCRECATHHDRDLNAATNILNEGLRLLAGSGFVGATTVEFAPST